jgi:hypothetical protein
VVISTDSQLDKKTENAWFHVFLFCQSGIMSYGDFKSCLASVGILVGDADCQATLSIEFVYENYSKVF